MTRIAERPSALPARAAVMARASGENFPVASRVLPRRARAHLLAVYGFARLVDELGDSGEGSPGERLAALDWLEGELDAAFAGAAQHPLMVALEPALRACRLPREPFVRLIEANRADQRVSRYDTWAQLREYCALSADPVGELVLRILGLASEERIAYSNAICTALQLAEHCQDVAEDHAAGRIYLPLADLARFRVAESELAGPATPRLRELMAFQLDRVDGLLASGGYLVGSLSGWARVAVAGYVAGGRAAVTAIRRADYDVTSKKVRTSRFDVVRYAAIALLRRRRETP